MATRDPQPQPDGPPAATPPRPRRPRTFLLLLAALLAGHLAVPVVWNFLSLPHGSFLPEPIWLNIFLLPLTALLTAALGPLFLVLSALYMFQVEGGTPAAVCSFFLGLLLLYAALVLALRRWWKTSDPAARRLGWLAWALYSALATAALCHAAFIT